MKHGARDVSAFVGSALGSGVIALIVFALFKGPCPENVFGVVLDNCVGSMSFGDFTKVAGGVCTVLGFVAAAISELLPDDN